MINFRGYIKYEDRNSSSGGDYLISWVVVKQEMLHEREGDIYLNFLNQKSN